MWQRAKVKWDPFGDITKRYGEFIWVRLERTRDGKEIARPNGGGRYVIKGQDIDWTGGFEGHLGSAFLELLPEFLGEDNDN